LIQGRASQNTAINQVEKLNPRKPTPPGKLWIIG
jgi:hypothetical protein